MEEMKKSINPRIEDYLNKTFLFKSNIHSKPIEISITKLDDDTLLMQKKFNQFNDIDLIEEEKVTSEKIKIEVFLSFINNGLIKPKRKIIKSVLR